MRINESKFRKLYKEHQESGLSVRDFCTNQDIAPATFYRWKKILEQKEAPNEFVPLIIGRSQLKDDSYQNHAPAFCKDITNGNKSLEFVFPNGTKLMLKGSIDIALLKTIVHLY